jgi:hypothetical protein
VPPVEPAAEPSPVEGAAQVVKAVKPVRKAKAVRAKPRLKKVAEVEVLTTLLTHTGSTALKAVTMVDTRLTVTTAH